MIIDIHTYEDLLRYRRDLEVKLEERREALRSEFKNIEDNIRPITGLAGKIARTFMPGNGRDLQPKAGGNLLYFLAKNIFFNRAGRLTKAIFYLLFG